MANRSVAKESLKEARAQANRLMGSLYHARYATDPSDPTFDEIAKCQDQLNQIAKTVEKALADVETSAK